MHAHRAQVKNQKELLAVDRDEIAADDELRPRPRRVGVLRPVGFRLGEQHRDGGGHADERRVDVVEVEAAELPVAQAGRQVADLINGGAVWTAAP